MKGTKDTNDIIKDVQILYDSKIEEYKDTLDVLNKSYTKKQIAFVTKLRFLGKELKVLKVMNEAYAVNNPK